MWLNKTFHNTYARGCHNIKLKIVSFNWLVHRHYMKTKMRVFFVSKIQFMVLQSPVMLCWNGSYIIKSLFLCMLDLRFSLRCNFGLWCHVVLQVLTSVLVECKYFFLLTWETYFILHIKYRMSTKELCTFKMITENNFCVIRTSHPLQLI